MNLIANDRKHLLKTETSQTKISFKTLYLYKCTRKVEDFQKLSYSEIHFTL